MEYHNHHLVTSDGSISSFSDHFPITCSITLIPQKIYCAVCEACVAFLCISIYVCMYVCMYFYVFLCISAVPLAMFSLYCATYVSCIAFLCSDTKKLNCIEIHKSCLVVIASASTFPLVIIDCVPVNHITDSYLAR